MARVLSRPACVSPSPPPSDQQPGGTAAYMAPELFEGACMSEALEVNETVVSFRSSRCLNETDLKPWIAQHTGLDGDQKADVFAFAVLLHEALTGEVPWAHLPLPIQIIFHVGVLKERIPIPSWCPPSLAQLMAQCWAEAPDDRPDFQTIQQALARM